MIDIRCGGVEFRGSGTGVGYCCFALLASLYTLDDLRQYELCLPMPGTEFEEWLCGFKFLTGSVPFGRVSGPKVALADVLTVNKRGYVRQNFVNNRACPARYSLDR